MRGIFTHTQFNRRFLLFLFKSRLNTALESMIWSPRNKIEHKYDAMFVFCVTVECDRETLSAVQALTNKYSFLCDKPDILSRLTCHSKAERECIYFQETTLKSKDDKQRKNSAVFYSPLAVL